MKFRRGGVERYRLDWPGKREAAKVANTPTTKTLRPCRDKSSDFDITENVVIEGDNLEALKLLQRSYLSRVKLIYIDPPYNTGNDFIYRDNFHQDRAEHSLASSQVSEAGEKLVANPESNGRFHSDWLSMMYSRLRLARNLLREDGVIFISIDNGEEHNLRKVCDEIFGEPNFVADIIWEKKFAPANDAKWFSDTHDYILVYAKNKLNWSPQLLPRTEKQNQRYKNDDGDPRGNWIGDNLSVKSYTEKYDYPITTPTGRKVWPPKGRCWTCSQERLEQLIAENRIWFGKDGDKVPTIKRFLSEVKEGIVPVTIWKHEDVGHNATGRRELKDLFDGQGIFDNPKPVSLLERIIHVANVQHGDIVLDFFAGSGTTAHAVMKYAAEKSLKLNFVLNQLDETTKEDSHAFKAGYARISDVTIDRIKRARKAIEGVYQKFSFQDYGFRTFKVDSSNLKDNYYNPTEITQDLLPSLIDTVKPERTNSEDLLFQVICDAGIELTLPIEEVKIADASVFVVGHDPVQLIACFVGELSQELFKELVRRRPRKLIFRQSMFPSDAEITNVIEFFKQKAPEIDVAFL